MGGHGAGDWAGCHFILAGRWRVAGRALGLCGRPAARQSLHAMPQRIGFVLLTHANTPQVRRLIGTPDRMFDAPPIVCHHDFSKSDLAGPGFWRKFSFVLAPEVTGWGVSRLSRRPCADRRRSTPGPIRRLVRAAERGRPPVKPAADEHPRRSWARVPDAFVEHRGEITYERRRSPPTRWFRPMPFTGEEPGGAGQFDSGSLAVTRIPIHRIQCVLDQQAQVGLAFHQQAAAEEQGVRVFLAERQGQVVAGLGGDGEVRVASIRTAGWKPRGPKGEAQRHAGVGYPSQQALAGEGSRVSRGRMRSRAS